MAVMKTRKVTLKIDNCLDCPYHKRVPAIAYDYFDTVDEDVVCTRTKGNHVFRYGNVPHEAITVSNRPWQTRKEASIPGWCPLLKVKAK